MKTNYNGSPLSIIINPSKAIANSNSTTSTNNNEVNSTSTEVYSNSYSSTIGKYDALSDDYVKSIFNSNGFKVSNGYSKGSFMNYNNPSDYYTDDMYNYTIPELITWSSKISSMTLKASDFAYIKNLGVYPSNRLIIVRRFPSGASDDLTEVDAEPIATMVSYYPENEDFISCEFGEIWIPATDSFKSLINDIGNDMTFNSSDNKSGAKSSNGWGSIMARGLDIVPLPGLTENFQYRILKKLGWTDVDPAMIPFGNPNMIREAKMRKTLGNEGGSTLVGRFKIKFEVEYEIEYYPNLDPTFAYMDIMANALSFGTSTSTFQLNPTASKDMTAFLGDISSGQPNRVKDALLRFIMATAKAIKEMAVELMKSITDIIDKSKANAQEVRDRQQRDEANGIVTDEFDKKKELAEASLKPTMDALQNLTTSVIQTILNKYKIKLIGVVHALTGQASGEWHVTIGNPKKPIFSSGDMIIANNVEMTTGNTLGFNDLPTSIKFSFTLENARNVGAQEIYRKFNCGKTRSYIKIAKSMIENTSSIKVDDNDVERIKNSVRDTVKKTEEKSANTTSPPIIPPIDQSIQGSPNFNKYGGNTTTNGLLP